MKIKQRIFRFLGSLLVSLLALSVGAYFVVQAFSADLAARTGAGSSVVKSSDLKDYTYQSDYATLTQLWEKHISFSEEVEESGAVLLQNDGALPLASGTTVSLVGAHSYSMFYGGQVGSTALEAQTITLETALTERGFVIDTAMKSYYEDKLKDLGSLTATFGTVSGPIDGYTVGKPAAPSPSNIGSGVNTAIVVVSRSASEAASYYLGEDGKKDPSEWESSKNALGLTKNEQTSIEFAINNYDTVVVLINSTSAMEVPEFTGEYAELAKTSGTKLAVMWVGFPGNFGARGIVDLLR